jgi:WD40 repeat protein
VVALWDANANMELMQYEEHAKRVWAVDFSRLDPTRLASCSDDGTVRVWAINQEACAARINCRVRVGHCIGRVPKPGVPYAMHASCELALP